MKHVSTYIRQYLAPKADAKITILQQLSLNNFGRKMLTQYCLNES